MLTSKARLPLWDRPNHTFTSSEEDGEETQLTKIKEIRCRVEYMVEKTLATCLSDCWTLRLLWRVAHAQCEDPSVQCACPVMSCAPLRGALVKLLHLSLVLMWVTRESHRL